MITKKTTVEEQKEIATTEKQRRKYSQKRNEECCNCFLEIRKRKRERMVRMKCCHEVGSWRKILVHDEQ
jgi:hypothetical protein